MLMEPFRRSKFQIHNEQDRFGHFICCMLCLCISMFLAACSRDGTTDKDAVSDSSVPYTAAQEREWVYVPEVFTVGDERVDYERMQPVGDTFCYLSLGEEAVNSVRDICQYSLTDQALKSAPVNWPEGGSNWDVGYRFFTQDQNLYMTANVYPEEFGSMKRFLCRFDLAGNCLFSKDITEMAGADVSLCGLNVDSQGRVYLFLDNGEALLYTGGGDYHGSVSCSSPEDQMPARIKGACEGADGKLYVCISQAEMKLTEENSEGTDSVRCTLAGIDFDNARMIKVAEGLPNLNGLCGGKQPDKDSAGASDDSGSQYDLLLYDDVAVYGYCLGEQESDSGWAGEEVFTWIDSDINGYFVTNLYLLEDGRLCATVEDWVNDDRAIVMLERTKAEQAPRREELVLATVNGGSDLAGMAVRFNRGSSQYHLTLKNYESLTDLYNAILAKEPMDLIDLSGINVQRLAARGVFEDLTSYVDQSEAFDRSDFVDGILGAYTFDNTLAGIPAEFLVRTVVGNGARLQNKAGLTLEELYSLADRYPGTRAFDGVTKEEVMELCLMFNEDAFINWDTGTCHFDSDGFKALLEYVDQYPDSAAGGGEEEALFPRLQRGEVQFAIAELYPPLILKDYVRVFGEDAACVGFPTPDGQGGHLLIGSDAYAIAVMSEHKDAAWSFIEESLTQEKDNELYAGFYVTYPALKKTLDKRAEAAIERGDLTWDEVNIVLELLPEATPFYSVKEDEILQIIHEEAGAYYSGQKGIDDVASVIQNRVQLYVDENRT